MGARKHAFETMGNATCLLYEDGGPLLVTDPWLMGTAYYGSWAHYHPLSDVQRARCIAAPFVWFSHGHPDHLHPESVALLPRDVTILIGDHYSSVIYDFLIAQGFQKVQVCKDKAWIQLSPEVRVFCISNMNQDTILVIEIGNTVIVNQNDSPLMGEGAFLRNTVRRYKNSYLLALCTNNADMINCVDERGTLIAKDPSARKHGTIVEVGNRCSYLGVRNFCCFSSQHIYVRSDSVWANPFHIDWRDMQQHWAAKSTRLIEPYVTIDLDSGNIARNHQSQQPDLSQITDSTADDDWSEKMMTEDWCEVGNYFSKFKTLHTKVDFLEFVVGGERRKIFQAPTPKFYLKRKPRGIVFHVPRRSLMNTIRDGFFDDLLIGNFMKTQLVNIGLYPDFSPRIAKYGDAAKVYSSSQLARMRWHYFKRSPLAMTKFLANTYLQYCGLPRIKTILEVLGLLEVAKELRGRLSTLK